MPLEVNISVRGIAGDNTDTFGNIRSQSARQPLPRRRPREYVDSLDYQRYDRHEQGVPIEFFDRPAPRRPRIAQSDEVTGQGHSVRSRTSSSYGSHYRPEDEGEASDVAESTGSGVTEFSFDDDVMGTPGRPIGAPAEARGTPICDRRHRLRLHAPASASALARDRQPRLPVRPQPAHPAVSQTRRSPRPPSCISRTVSQSPADQRKHVTEAKSVAASGATSKAMLECTRRNALRAADPCGVHTTGYPVRPKLPEGFLSRSKPVRVDGDARSSSSAAELGEGRDDPAACFASNASNVALQHQPRAFHDYQISITGMLQPSIDYLVRWDRIEIAGHRINDRMKRYIQWIANHHQLRFHRSVVLEHDAAWDRGLPADDAHLHNYYILNSFEMNTASVPAATRNNKVMFWAHATTEGGLRGILQERCIRPMEAHGVPQCKVFYALGHELWGHEYDVRNIARVVHNAWRGAKNSSKLLVIGKAWGSLASVGGGSYVTASLASRKCDTMKDKNAKAYCVHTSLYTMQGLAFSVDSDPPAYPI